MGLNKENSLKKAYGNALWFSFHPFTVIPLPFRQALDICLQTCFKALQLKSIKQLQSTYLWITSTLVLCKEKSIKISEYRARPNDYTMAIQPMKDILTGCALMRETFEAQINLPEGCIFYMVIIFDFQSCPCLWLNIWCMGKRRDVFHSCYPPITIWLHE